jgi:hypothetical protein
MGCVFVMMGWFLCWLLWEGWRSRSRTTQPGRSDEGECRRENSRWGLIMVTPSREASNQQALVAPTAQQGGETRDGEEEQKLRITRDRDTRRSPFLTGISLAPTHWIGLWRFRGDIAVDDHWLLLWNGIAAQYRPGSRSNSKHPDRRLTVEWHDHSGLGVKELWG